MTIASILREAWRNLVSGTTRAVTLALLLGSVSAGLTAAELTAVRAITDAAVAFTTSAASIATLAASGRIDGDACEALGTIPGVRAAGAIRSTDEGMTAAALPSSAIPVMEVTSGFAEVVRATSLAPSGVVVSQQVVDGLALAPGEAIVTRDGRAEVAGTYPYPDDGRRAGYGYAALVPTTTDAAFDECWIDMWPPSPQTATLLQITLTGTDEEGERPLLSQLNTTLGATFDGPRAFHDRITRHVPLVALLVGGGLGFVSVRTRRVQHASALHAGVATSDLVTISTLELAAWTAPSIVLSASVIAVFAATGPPGDMLVSAVLGARIAPLAVAGALVGSVAALLATRERHLFRYVKER